MPSQPLCSRPSLASSGQSGAPNLREEGHIPFTREHRCPGLLRLWRRRPGMRSPSLPTLSSCRPGLTTSSYNQATKARERVCHSWVSPTPPKIWLGRGGRGSAPERNPSCLSGLIVAASRPGLTTSSYNRATKRKNVRHSPSLCVPALPSQARARAGH